MLPSGSKRQKVTIACDPCRTRKTKCDGRGPTCQPCQKRAGSGIKCTWQTSDARMAWHPATEHDPWVNVPPSSLHQGTSSHDSNAARGTSAAPDGRRSRAGRAAAKPPQHPIQPVAYPSARSQLPLSASESFPQTLHRPGLGFPGLHQRQDSTRTSYEVSPSDHSIHAIIGATLEEDSREGFFGSSSAGTFMQNVKKMVLQKIDGVQQIEQPSSYQQPQTQLPLASGHNTILQKPVEYVLPSRRKADILLFAYWKYVHVLYPLLDRMQMQKDYESLWRADGSVSDERSFICLLNVVFALSSQVDESTPIEDRGQLAKVFYTRARELLDVVETGSVRSVQSFLLLGQYFQSTSESHPCWVFVGLGVRTAQSLGLHLAETSERAPDTKTRELLRRVWYGCVLMDRIVSMTYGRPCMIGPKAAISVTLPVSIEEPHLVPEFSQSGEPSVQTQQTFAVEFFVVSLKLYEILHDVIFNFYSVNFQQHKSMDRDIFFGSQSENQCSVFEVERRLLKWEQKIPDRLRAAIKSQGEGAEAISYRQAVVLHQRQLQVRILLLRPVLSNFITSEFHDRDGIIPLGALLSHRIVLQCAIVCVKVALEAINTIYTEKASNPSQNGYLAAWWYNVLYLYTSATVLITARLSPAILAEISEESVLDGWYKAIEVLEGYKPFGVAIHRLTTTLRLLFEAVPQQYSRFRDNFRRVQADTVSSTRNQGQGAGALPYWRPTGTIDFVSPPINDLPPEHPHDDINALPDDTLFDFDIGYDPDDFSWLMSIPLDA